MGLSERLKASKKSVYFGDRCSKDALFGRGDIIGELCWVPRSHW